MKVRDVMTRDVQVARPGDTIQQIARLMLEADTGAVPVTDEQTVIGMITDRDIVLRVVAEGRSLDLPVSEVMTPNVEFCMEDDDLVEVSEKMGRLQVRRMIILSQDRKLAGILSLGDLAQETDLEESGLTLEEISKPSSTLSH